MQDMAATHQADIGVLTYVNQGDFGFFKIACDIEGVLFDQRKYRVAFADIVTITQT